MTADKASNVVPRLRFPGFRDAPEWSMLRGDTLFNTINNRSAASGLPVLAITQEHGAIPRDQIDYHVSVTAESVASYKEVREDDFIISLRSFQGGIEHSRYHGICSPAYVILRRKGVGNDHFFRHLFKSERFIQQMTQNIEGIRDGKMISYAQFSEQLLPVPEPSEQTKIADCLGNLDDLIAAADRKLEALRQHKQGLMQQLFPQPGETQPILRIPEFRNSADWQKVSLTRLLTFQNGYPFSTRDFGEERQGLRLIRNRDLRSEDRVVYYDGHPLSDFIVNDGDLLVGMDGDFTPCVWYKGTGLLNQRVGRVLPRNKHVLQFLGYLLEIHLKAVQEDTARTTVKHLSSKTVEGMVVHVPNPNEQQSIADCLGSLDDLIAAEGRKLDTLKQHKQGLLQQLIPSLDGQ